MLTDFVKAWNQGKNPDLYELENAAMDREGIVWDALSAIAPGPGRPFWTLVVERDSGFRDMRLTPGKYLGSNPTSISCTGHVHERRKLGSFTVLQNISHSAMRQLTWSTLDLRISFQHREMTARLGLQRL